MTLEIDSDGTVTADFAHIDEISFRLLQALRTEPVGYGAMGCAMTLGRLANPEVKLAPQTEVKFVGDLMGMAIYGGTPIPSFSSFKDIGEGLRGAA